MREQAIFVLAVCTALTTVTSDAAGAGGARVEARGAFSFQPNQRVQGTLQWHDGEQSVRSGDRLTIVSADEVPGEPHIFTVVGADEQPKTLDELFSGSTCHTCRAALAVHDENLDGKPPFVDVVPAGQDGLDAIGDSFLLDDGVTLTQRVTAPSGTTLHFICSIHNEMQGVLHVT